MRSSKSKVASKDKSVPPWFGRRMARHLQVTVGGSRFGEFGVIGGSFSISWVLAWRFLITNLNLVSWRKARIQQKSLFQKKYTRFDLPKIPTEDTFVNLNIIIVSVYRLDPWSHPGCKGRWQMKGLGWKFSKTLVVMSQHHGCGGVFHPGWTLGRWQPEIPRPTTWDVKKNLVDIGWYWDNLHFNWCRISLINSMFCYWNPTKLLTAWPFLPVEKLIAGRRCQRDFRGIWPRALVTQTQKIGIRRF